MLFKMIDEHHCRYTWFVWNNNSCKCGPISGLKNARIRCNQETHEVWIRRLACMTYDNITGSTTAGYCPFSIYPRSALNGHFVRLPKSRTELNAVTCGMANRDGLLCSKCKPGYGPAVLSYGYKCVKCSNTPLGWFLFLCVAFFPTTLFLILVVLFQVRTTSAPLNFFILACQMISVAISWYHTELDSQLYSSLGGAAATFFTLWNLEFFRYIIPPFCVSENLSNLQVLCMEYIVAFYPLLLTVIMYVCVQQHAKGCRILVCLWKPFAYCFNLTRLTSGQCSQV